MLYVISMIFQSDHSFDHYNYHIGRLKTEICKNH